MTVGVQVVIDANGRLESASITGMIQDNNLAMKSIKVSARLCQMGKKQRAVSPSGTTKNPITGTTIRLATIPITETWLK